MKKIFYLSFSIMFLLISTIVMYCGDDDDANPFPVDTTTTSPVETTTTTLSFTFTLTFSTTFDTSNTFTSLSTTTFTYQPDNIVYYMTSGTDIIAFPGVKSTNVETGVTSIPASDISGDITKTIGMVAVSPNNEYVAYNLLGANAELHVYNVNTQTDTLVDTYPTGFGGFSFAQEGSDTYLYFNHPIEIDVANYTLANGNIQRYNCSTSGTSVLFNDNVSVIGFPPTAAQGEIFNFPVVSPAGTSLFYTETYVDVNISTMLLDATVTLKVSTDFLDVDPSDDTVVVDPVVLTGISVSSMEDVLPFGLISWNSTSDAIIVEHKDSGNITWKKYASDGSDSSSGTDITPINQPDNSEFMKWNPYDGDTLNSILFHVTGTNNAAEIWTSVADIPSPSAHKIYDISDEREESLASDGQQRLYMVSNGNTNNVGANLHYLDDENP